jgi:hypothetical protein
VVQGYLIDVYEDVPVILVVPKSSVVIPEAVAMRTPICIIPIVILFIIPVVIPMIVGVVVSVIIPVRFSEFARFGRCLLRYSDCCPEQCQG